MTDDTKQEELDEAKVSSPEAIEADKKVGRKAKGDLVFVMKDVPVEIVGVGLIDGGVSARVGIPVADAAEVLRELQDAEQAPLKGRRLEEAARSFAEARGFAVDTMSEDEYTPKSGIPDVFEAARQDAERAASNTREEV